MKEYKARLVAPASNNKFYTERNPFHNCGYGLPNCTCYAFGRIYELTGKKPTLSTGDADDFYNHKDKYERGIVPRVGAVACWTGGADGCGHVAVVESIERGGAIVVSESCYGGDRFRVRKLGRGYNFGVYKFQGFIYAAPEFYPTAADVKNAVAKKSKSAQFDINADGVVNMKDVLERRRKK